MRHICSLMGKALARRQPALIGGGVRHTASRLGPARWSSSQISSIEVEDIASIQQDGPTRKGKERAIDDPPNEDRTALVKRMLLEAEKDLEQSKAWEETFARYPGIKPKQVSLVTLLTAVIQKMNKARASMSAKEVLKLHDTVLKADRHLRNLMAAERRFQESSVAFTMLLKYASRLRDARSLKIIAREALTWKHSQYATSSIRKRPRFIHPRVAAAEQLSKLIRNLFVSLSVRQRIRIRPDRGFLTPGVRLPLSNARFVRGDDAMTISMMLRQRQGAFRYARNEEGQTYIKLAKNAQVSRYPLTHQSSRIRWINRMAERGKLQRLMSDGTDEESKEMIATLNEGTLVPPIPAPNKSAGDVPNAQATALAPSSMQHQSKAVAVTKEDYEVMTLLSSRRGDEEQAQGMEQLQHNLSRWQKELSRRMNSRREMLGIVRQFRIRPDASKPETAEAIKKLLPAWLVLTVLRLQIESGDVRKAEKVVEVYLKSLSRVYPDKKLQEIIPVNEEKVHAVTSPLIPPNGSSLLNGLLRAHLNSGAKDCFEHMIQVVHKWTIHGKKFTQSVLKKKIEGDKLPVIPLLGECLVPNQNTVMILLEALRQRRSNYSLGKTLIEQMWSRWGIVGLRDEKGAIEALTEPEPHQALEIPQQAFTTLIRWAKKHRRTELRRQKVNDVIELEKRWREKATSSQRSVLATSIEQRLAWKRESRDCFKRERLTVDRDSASDADRIENEKEEVLRPPLYFTRND